MNAVTPPAPRVYGAIVQVMAAMSRQGIAKDRKNQAQNYSFRGIDDIFNALAGELSFANLCMLPTVLDRTCDERTSNKGATLFYVTTRVRFDLVSAEDGSTHSIVTVGEAMDSGDKATNKAMSAAYKYAALQAFCIPTEGDNDADAHSPVVKPKAAAPPKPTFRDQIRGECAVATTLDDITAIEARADYSNAIRKAAPEVAEELRNIVAEAKARLSPKPRPSVTEWLDAINAEFDGAVAAGADAVNAMIARDDLQRARNKLVNGAKDKLEQMISDALSRAGAADAPQADDGWPG